MMKALSCLVCAAALLAAPLARADDAMSGSSMGGSMGGTMGMKMSAPTSPADKAFAAAMQTMMKAMRVKYTGDADADFAAMMIPHHQGAIDMAKAELQYGADPELKQLATDIVAAQEKEIAAMQDWLAKHAK